MEIYLERARTALHNRDFYEAIEASAVAFAETSDPEASLLMISAYYSLQIYKRALTKIENALQMSISVEQKLQLSLYKANILTRLGHYDKAIIAYKCLTHEQSKKFRFYGYVGMGVVNFFIIKDLDLESQPEEEKRERRNTLVQEAFGCLAQAKNYAELISDYNLIYNNTGCINQLQDNHKEAIENFNTALETSEGFIKGEILNGLAISLNKLGLKEESRSSLKQAKDIFINLKHTEGLGRNIRTAGLIEKENGNLDEAADYYRQAKKIFSDKELYHLAAEVSKYLADLYENVDKELSAQYLAEYYINLEKRRGSKLCAGYLEQY